MNSRYHPEFEQPIKVHKKNYPVVWYNYTNNDMSNDPLMMRGGMGEGGDRKLFNISLQTEVCTLSLHMYS